MVEPYYTDPHVQLYLGDMREVLPALGIQADACITDPPYASTKHSWDHWPDGWPTLVAERTSSMWTFGSLRMFIERQADFITAGWRLSHDIVGEYELDTMVWEKHNGTSAIADRIRRVHELAAHWYRGPWDEIHHHVPRVQRAGAQVKNSPGPTRSEHFGAMNYLPYQDDGTRMVRSVLKAPSVRSGVHRTQKPAAVLAPLIQYACPVGGLVLDPFAGSGSTLLTARSLGRRAVGIEADERHAEDAARELDAADLFTEEVFRG